jgi:hypothetical protein
MLNEVSRLARRRGRASTCASRNSNRSGFDLVPSRRDGNRPVGRLVWVPSDEIADAAQQQSTCVCSNHPALRTNSRRLHHRLSTVANDDVVVVGVDVEHWEGNTLIGDSVAILGRAEALEEIRFPRLATAEGFQSSWIEQHEAKQLRETTLEVSSGNGHRV